MVGRGQVLSSGKRGLPLGGRGTEIMDVGVAHAVLRVIEDVDVLELNNLEATLMQESATICQACIGLLTPSVNADHGVACGAGSPPGHIGSPSPT